MFDARPMAVGFRLCHRYRIRRPDKARRVQKTGSAPGIMMTFAGRIECVARAPHFSQPPPFPYNPPVPRRDGGIHAMTSRPAKITRRNLLRRTTAAAFAAGLPAWFVEETLAQPQAPPPTSPNDRPGIALIGCGGQGINDAKQARRFGDVVAICDVDDHHAADAALEFP